MTQFVRRAEWIWRWRGLHKLAFMGSEPPFAEERNRYLYFRKSIDLTATVKETQVFVSADGRYQLFVNGQRVGRGPVRCAPAFQSLDYYNLAPFLRPGANHIVALVHSYGRHTAWYELPAMEQARAFGCGGFFLQGDVETEVGTLCLDTGTSWHCLEAAAWQREAPSCSLGFNEIYDARLAWNGLTPEYNPDLDPNDWQPVEVLRVPARNFADDIVPFPNLVVSDLPPMREAEELPVAVVSIHEVEDDNSTNDVATLFANQPLQRLQTCQVTHSNALLSHEHATEIITTPTHSVSLVIDFGQVVTGRLQFEVEGTAGTQIDFTYGERLEDGGRVRSIAGIPGLDAPVAHRYILAEGRQRWQQFERAGFRYVQVSVRKATIPLRIHWLTLMSSSYPAKERGEFRCSDPLLTQIWRTGGETLRRCMHDGYEDCPGREQRQWVGDAYTMLLINYAAFGDVRLARRFLRQVAQSQRGDGLTAVMTPGDFSIRNTFNIPDFCLYWIMALANHVECSGDLALADELFPSVLRAIAWFERYLDQDDLLNDVPHWVFVDWAEIDKRGQVSALNAHFVATLRFAAKLARQIVEERQARRLESIAERVTRAINQHLWDEERGVYVDARRNQKRSRRVSQQTNAMMIAYDVAPKVRWDRILARILDEQRLVLTRTGDADPNTIPFDEEEQIVLAQPFTMHHLHRALQQAGRHTTMLDNIRQRWGAWVEAGEATFWESWQLNPITSLCHAWSGTPTHDLTAYVLGVTPDGTTLRSVQIAPNPAGLRWAEGIAPTPYGDIAVAWHWEVDHFELAVELPLDMQATLRLPTVISEHATSISLNDAPLHEKRVRLQTGKHRLVAVMR